MVSDKLSIEDKKPESLTSKLKGIISTVAQTGVVLLTLTEVGLIGYSIMLKPTIDACKIREQIVREKEDLKQIYTRSLNFFGDIDMDGEISGEERLRFNLNFLEYLRDKGITIKMERFDGGRFRDVFAFVYTNQDGFPTDNVVQRGKWIEIIRDYRFHLEDLMSDDPKGYLKEVDAFDTFEFGRYKPLLEKDLF